MKVVLQRPNGLLGILLMAALLVVGVALLAIVIAAGVVLLAVGTVVGLVWYLRLRWRRRRMGRKPQPPGQGPAARKPGSIDADFKVQR